ncbi:hypothetical protein RIF29_18275 [Crotalaria pallida]|uniref:Uncharacterized protein n=1 Tax=Crotalaria pallida TaxID=3830 RepID=A0AAN9FPK8_CROPI
MMLTKLFLHHHRRHISTTATTTTTTVLSKLPSSSSKYKKLDLTQAQHVLTDYLHATRCLPYPYADQIAKNSSLSLSNLISNHLHSASSSSFTFRTLDKFLRYHPINEFEFFFESIGISYAKLHSLLPHNKFFFSEDASLLDAAVVLSEFGFPWEKLGLMYLESGGCVFRRSVVELKGRLCWFKRFGFCNDQVIGICLAFPFVFGGGGGEEEEREDRFHGLLDDLKLVLLDYDLAGSAEGNAGSWYEVCRKIRVFYDLNGGKGKIGELIRLNKDVILGFGEEELVRTVKYFCRFGVKKEEVALLILRGPELLNLNLETPVVNVLKLLKHFRLSSEDLGDVRRDYAHVLGTIKMANLPNVMRALGLHEWFFNKLKDGNHHLLVRYMTTYPNEDQDKDYRCGLETIRVSRTPTHNMNKLNFLHSKGFGENALTMNILHDLHGNSCELQERFDCLLNSGIELSKVCKMITLRPRILSQNPKSLQEKIDFIRQEMGNSVELLCTFPAFLCHDLEKRIKPRYRFHMWIKEKGLSEKNYSLASMIATSNKNFVVRVCKMHPAAPKHWFEQFYPSKLPV